MFAGLTVMAVAVVDAKFANIGADPRPASVADLAVAVVDAIAEEIRTDSGNSLAEIAEAVVVAMAVENDTGDDPCMFAGLTTSADAVVTAILLENAAEPEPATVAVIAVAVVDATFG